MIVPQLASGGWTPIERNESADSVSMLFATISGKKTITVVTTFGSTSEKIRRRLLAPRPIAASTNSLLADRQHLSADRARDVRHEDEADDR